MRRRSRRALRRYRHYQPVGTRSNPIGDNLVLVGVGVVALLAVVVAFYSSTAQASTGNVWPASQFSNGVGTGAGATVGEYVLLTDNATGRNIIVQVTAVSSDGTSGMGTVYYAPASASQANGDTVNFNIANVISSNSSSAILQGLL